MSIEALSKETTSKLDSLDQPSLLLRRSELIAKGKPEELNDTDLQELCYIHNLLRRKSSGPPKETKKKPGSSMLPDRERLASLL